jgi:hypothetical protein
LLEEFEYWNGKGKKKDKVRRICKTCDDLGLSPKTKGPNYKRNLEFRLISPELTTLRLARLRARTQEIPFDIDVEDIHIPETCPVLGIPLVSNAGDGGPGYGLFNSPSLDKIIPELGYVKGNITVMSNLANTMKNCGTLEQCVLLGKWAEKMIVVRDYLTENK